MTCCTTTKFWCTISHLIRFKIHLNRWLPSLAHPLIFITPTYCIQFKAHITEFWGLHKCMLDGKVSDLFGCSVKQELLRPHFTVSHTCFEQCSPGGVSFCRISQTVVPQMNCAPYLRYMVRWWIRSKWMIQSWKPLSVEVWLQGTI